MSRANGRARFPPLTLVAITKALRSHFLRSTVRNAVTEQKLSGLPAHPFGSEQKKLSGARDR